MSQMLPRLMRKGLVDQFVLFMKFSVVVPECVDGANQTDVRFCVLLYSYTPLQGNTLRLLVKKTTSD